MGGRRYLIYTPRINPDTFVFFFLRGTSGRSFSIRDFSYEPVLRLDAKDYARDVTDRIILAWANEPECHCIEDVDPHPVDDVDYWREVIAKVNRLRLGKDLDVRSHTSNPPGAGEWQFPMLDLEVFRAFPKARKTKDVERMQISPRSEDWVTWNVVRLLDRHDRSIWWPAMLDGASQQAADPIDLNPPTRISPWVSVAAPASYEAASRHRMATSGDPTQIARASHPDPVEGHSEVDVVIEGDGYLIYLEAKLFSDISLATTHDPDRNQLVRNVDCVLEHGGGRQPLFWMAVRDRAPHRMYVKVVQEWKRNPSLLAIQLPHHAPNEIERLVNRIAIISWTELLAAITPRPDEVEVWKELQRRIN